jgi:hypothetical protein
MFQKSSKNLHFIFFRVWLSYVILVLFLIIIYLLCIDLFYFDYVEYQYGYLHF